MILIFGGCGSGDETTTSLTKPQFVKRANELCKARQEDRNQEIEEVTSTLKPGEGFSDAEQTKLVQTLIIPSYEKTISDLKKLEPPAGDEAEVEKIITSMESTQKKLEADPEEAVFTTVMFEPPNKLVRSYGLSNCAF